MSDEIKVVAAAITEPSDEAPTYAGVQPECPTCHTGIGPIHVVKATKELSVGATCVCPCGNRLEAWA